jgi:DnaJ-class molecular chaperone
MGDFMDVDDERYYGHSRSPSPDPRSMAKPRDVDYDLNCTLEEIYAGKTKKMRITRTVEDMNTGNATQAWSNVARSRVLTGACVGAMPIPIPIRGGAGRGAGEEGLCD